MRWRASIAVVGVAVAVGAYVSDADPAGATETGMTSEGYSYTGTHPDAAPTYRYFDNWQKFDTPYSTRTYNARQTWNNDSDASFSIVYSTASNNRVGWLYLTDPAIGLASWPCTENDSAPVPWCTLYMDRGVFWDGNWYTGTGTTPSGQYDFQGVITQEFGHWLGLGHKSCSSMYEVPPDLEITTLCPTDLDEKMRSLSQDDLQGVEIWFDATFAVNRGFEDCCDGVNVAKYWSVTPGANKVLWCSGGAHSGSCLMGLNDNPSVPYPELYQFASGPDIDVDNDGRFMIRAWVKAVHNAVTPRAVVFIRHWHGSYSAGYANHEQKCDSGTLTVGVWTKVQCTFTLGSYTQQTFQYGVRVTEKIDIDDVWYQDN